MSFQKELRYRGIQRGCCRGGFPIRLLKTQRSKAAQEHIECSPTAAKAACLTVRRGGFYIRPPRPQRSKAAREHIECSPTAAKAACLTVRRGGFPIRPRATDGRPYKQQCRFSVGPQCCHITHHRGRAETALPLQVVCKLFKFCRLFCSGDADQALSFFFLVPISTPIPPTTSSAPMPLNSSVPKPPVVGRLKPFLLMMVVSTY